MQGTDDLAILALPVRRAGLLQAARVYFREAAQPPVMAPDAVQKITCQLLRSHGASGQGDLHLQHRGVLDQGRDLGGALLPGQRAVIRQESK